MPFDAVGFPTDHAAKGQPAPVTLRGAWRSFRDRLRDASGRHQPGVTATVLREARSLISDKSSWVQGAYERAGRRCAMGALQAVGRNYWRAARRDAAAELLHVARMHGHHSVESMNNSLTHPEVLTMFDTAIARVEFGPARG